MNKIHYLVRWGNNKETAWSGTNYSLFRALQNYYEVHDVDLKRFKLLDIFMHRILRFDWFTSDYYWQKWFKFRYREFRGKVLQMSGIVRATANVKTYIYQDLSVSYVKYMMDNLPEVFAVSGFQGVKRNVLIQRCLEQNNYYTHHCTAIFTMGKWLAEYLKTQDYCKDKVFPIGGDKHKC